MPSMGFTEEHLPGATHVCLIFENEDQRRRTVSEFLAAGVRQKEMVRYFADATSPETVRAWLVEKGVEVAAAEESGAFAISNAVSAYCPGGSFEPKVPIAGAMQRYIVAERDGFTGVRTSGEMSWVLKGNRGSERFLEYEALLNTISIDFSHTGMCQYDARLFDGATLFNVLQVHPFMVAQGQVVRNPYYAKPGEPSLKI